MKTRQFIASTLITFVVFGTAVASANPLDLTLTNPDQTVTQGTATIAFDAMISNPTANTVYLNGDAAATSSLSLSVDDSPFFANAPLSLAPGQSSGLIELFELDIGANTPVGTYQPNMFSILGGADGEAFSDIAEAQFSVTVNPATVPEPAPIALFGIGIAALAFMHRKRIAP